MGARHQVGIGLSYRPASLCSLATQSQTRFLESIPRPIAGLKFPTQGLAPSSHVFFSYLSIRPVCIPELPALMVQNYHWPLIGRDLLYGRKPGGAGGEGPERRIKTMELTLTEFLHSFLLRHGYKRQTEKE
jgi:hypothetical protein